MGWFWNAIVEKEMSGRNEFVCKPAKRGLNTDLNGRLFLLLQL